jgi:hypothetical protein
MKSIINNLSSEQVEALIALCEESSSYKEACAQACESLGIKLSPSTLCRLYTTHQIREDAQTRADYASSAKIEPNQILRLAADQLELRLLELASRPNPSASDLRALFQIITRLEALKLSRRRVAVAERKLALAEDKEQRANQPEPPKPSLTPTEITRRVRIALGKSTADLPPEPDSQNSQSTAEEDEKQKQQVRWVKQLLGKEITIGDELLDDAPPNS